MNPLVPADTPPSLCLSGVGCVPVDLDLIIVGGGIGIVVLLIALWLQATRKSPNQ